MDFVSLNNLTLTLQIRFGIISLWSLSYHSYPEKSLLLLRWETDATWCDATFFVEEATMHTDSTKQLREMPVPLWMLLNEASH